MTYFKKWIHYLMNANSKFNYIYLLLLIMVAGACQKNDDPDILENKFANEDGWFNATHYDVKDKLASIN